MKVWRILEDDAFGERLLKLRTVIVEQSHIVMGFGLRANNTHVDVGVLKVGCRINLLDGDQLGLKSVFARDEIAELAPDEFVDPFEAMFHG